MRSSSQKNRKGAFARVWVRMAGHRQGPFPVVHSRNHLQWHLLFCQLPLHACKWHLPSGEYVLCLCHKAAIYSKKVIRVVAATLNQRQYVWYRCGRHLNISGACFSAQSLVSEEDLSPVNVAPRALPPT